MRFAAAVMALAILASLCACGVQHEGIYITTDGIYYLDKNGEKMTGYIESEGTLYYFGEDGKLVEDSALWPTEAPPSEAPVTPDPTPVPDTPSTEEPQPTEEPATPAPSDDDPSIAPPEVGGKVISELTDDMSACSPDLLSEIDAVIAKVDPGENATTEERLWSVFEWMTKELKYQYITVDISGGYTEDLIAELGEHVIFELRGSCEHQAALYCLFARRLGCKAMVVEGEFLSDDGSEWVEHGWVIVEHDGVNRHCDVLFGRNHTGGKPRTMFLINDTDMSEKHRWDTSKYPVCE